MKELVVISGKGGSGKTSVVASFAALAGDAVLVDCDVDAADLHLVLAPRELETHSFVGGSKARIDPDRCIGCGVCLDNCRFGAILAEEAEPGFWDPPLTVDPIACEGCGVCEHFCPENAVTLEPVVTGHRILSETRFGPLIHARLEVAAENTGKMVTVLRKQARDTAIERGKELILVDGSPGIGCPVIASATGADHALIVTEPTVSGLYDLKRVAELAAHFELHVMICINKWDLDPEMGAKIESWSRTQGIRCVGRIRYDRAVTAAQVEGIPVVEYRENGVSTDLRSTWDAVSAAMASNQEKRGNENV